MISQTHLLGGHQISNNVGNIDQRGVSLFYCKSGPGLLDLEEIIAPRDEIKLVIKTVNNPENKNYFSENVRDFEKIFPDEEKILEYDEQNKIIKSFREEYKKNVELFEKTKRNLIEENEKKMRSRKRTYFTTTTTC